MKSFIHSDRMHRFVNKETDDQTTIQFDIKMVIKQFYG